MHKAIFLTGALFLGGCASAGYTLTGVPVGQQILTMARGTATMRSAHAHSVVTVQPVDADLHGNLGLWVGVDNLTGRPGNFGTENVAVSFDGITWQPVKTYEQLRAKLDSDAGWKKFAALLVGGLDAYQQSRTAGVYTANSTISGPFGTTNISSTFVDGSERQAAVNAAGARTAMTMGAIDAQHDASISQLDALALRTTTVQSGSYLSGVVVADAPALNRDSGSPILVRVNFLGDTHVLEFQAHYPGAFQPTALPDAGTEVLTAEAKQSVPIQSLTGAQESTGSSQARDAGDRASTNGSEIPAAFTRFSEWKSPAR